MKKILVIGSKGFIGTEAIRYFQSQKYAVAGCDITAGDNSTDYFQVESNEPNYNEIFRQARPDLCLNASGAASVPISFDEPFMDFQLNVINVLRMLEAIRLESPEIAFINVSSAAVYGTPSQLPVRENDRIAPISPYGWHKRQSEIICREYADLYNLRTCSVRVFSAYGPGLKKQLFWDLYQKTRKGKVIELLGTGEESRDYIFVEDLVRASETIAINAKLQGEVINVATGIETTIKNAAKSFIKTLGWDGRISFSGIKRMGDPENWCADISKLEMMGFKPKCSLESGMEVYCKWLQSLQQV
jgi:dTDP-glucose 4,6-dehydratase/UDP-glucose 4-epimerase